MLGAGVGVVLLGIGMFVAGSTQTGAENTVRAASVGGFVATMAALAVLWRRREQLSA